MNEVINQSHTHTEYDFFERVYGVLFNPNETFDKIKENPPIIEALWIVVAVSVVSPLIGCTFGNCHNVGLFVISLFNASISGIMKWLFFGGFVEAVASIFKNGNQFKKFLTLSGFALLPWVFLGPVTLLKTGGILGALFGILFGIAIWVWATILTIFAAMKAYNISSGRILLLVSIPFLGGVLVFNWLFGFFSTLFGILKV